MPRPMYLFRCTYSPDRPNFCKVEKIAEAPFALERFASKEAAFRKFAEENGIDTTAGRYSAFVERSKGLTFDHSALIVPTGNGNDYHRVAFYS